MLWAGWTSIWDKRSLNSVTSDENVNKSVTINVIFLLFSFSNDLCDLDLCAFDPKMAISVTCARENITTKFGVSTGFNSRIRIGRTDWRTSGQTDARTARNSVIVQPYREGCIIRRLWFEISNGLCDIDLGFFCFKMLLSCSCTCNGEYIGRKWSFYELAV